MKKLGKLSINSEKVIKNDELINLKGGAYSNLCSFGPPCYCCDANGDTQCANDPSLPNAFCDYWEAAGYTCDCYIVYTT